MKKSFISILSAAIVLSLAACGPTSTSTNDKDSDIKTETTLETSTTIETSKDNGDDDIVVSHGGTIGLMDLQFTGKLDGEEKQLELVNYINQIAGVEVLTSVVGNDKAEIKETPLNPTQKGNVICMGSKNATNSHAELTFTFAKNLKELKFNIKGYYKYIADTNKYSVDSDMNFIATINDNEVVNQKITPFDGSKPVDNIIDIPLTDNTNVVTISNNLGGGAHRYYIDSITFDFNE